WGSRAFSRAACRLSVVAREFGAPPTHAAWLRAAWRRYGIHQHHRPALCDGVPAGEFFLATDGAPRSAATGEKRGSRLRRTAYGFSSEHSLRDRWPARAAGCRARAFLARSSERTLLRHDGDPTSGRPRLQ